MNNFFPDGHKLHWHLDRLAAWQQDRSVAPIYLEISPVAYCNHRCIFCGVDFAMNHAFQLDAQLLGRRLTEMKELGVRSIMYAGEGEPLLHKELPALVQQTKSQGIDVSLTTNGSLGNDGLWQQMLPSLSWLKFSIDAGSAEVYAAVHRVPPMMFERTQKSLASAVAIKKQNHLDIAIGVQFLVMEENVADLERAFELFLPSGIDYLLVKPYSQHPQMIARKTVDYSSAAIDRIQKLVDKYAPQNGAQLIFRRGAMERYSAGTPAFQHCYAIPFWGYIDSRGDFYTCSVFIGDTRFRAGNICQETMRDIFFGAARRASIDFAERDLGIGAECRTNCRMARINEFLALMAEKPAHVNFI